MSRLEADRMRAELTRLRTALAAIVLVLEGTREFRGRRLRPLVTALVADILALLHRDQAQAELAKKTRRP